MSITYFTARASKFCHIHCLSIPQVLVLNRMNSFPTVSESTGRIFGTGHCFVNFAPQDERLVLTHLIFRKSSNPTARINSDPKLGQFNWQIYRMLTWFSPKLLRSRRVTSLGLLWVWFGFALGMPRGLA